jgi:hypothetical protein
MSNVKRFVNHKVVVGGRILPLLLKGGSEVLCKVMSEVDGIIGNA